MRSRKETRDFNGHEMQARNTKMPCLGWSPVQQMAGQSTHVLARVCKRARQGQRQTNGEATEDVAAINKREICYNNRRDERGMGEGAGEDGVRGAAAARIVSVVHGCQQCPGAALREARICPGWPSAARSLQGAAEAHQRHFRALTTEGLALRSLLHWSSS